MADSTKRRGEILKEITELGKLQKEAVEDVQANQVGESPSLWVDLFQRQRCFHSGWSSGGTEIALVVERAVNTGNDFEGKRPELIVLSSEDDGSAGRRSSALR